MKRNKKYYGDLDYDPRLMGVPMLGSTDLGLLYFCKQNQDVGLRGFECNFTDEKELKETIGFLRRITLPRGDQCWYEELDYRDGRLFWRFTDAAKKKIEEEENEEVKSKSR